MGGEAGGLRIRLLGDLTAQRAGEEIDLGGPRQRAVLALLIVARGDVVPAERLVDHLWGDRAPANALATLQSYLSHLRKALEPNSTARGRSQVIVRQGAGYAIRLPTDAVDAWLFEHLLHEASAQDDDENRAAALATALALWRGPALARYENEVWAGAEAARLTQLRHVARELWAAARLNVGDPALLVPDLEAMVAAEPLREERWRLLVLALYRSHRQADALAALRRARGVLADELGIDPGPALRTLEAEVLAQSSALEAPKVPERSTPRIAADLLEREEDVTTMLRALEDTGAGLARVVLVEGPAGIGKTRLLAELRHLASARGTRVLSARGSPMERAFGYGVVRQLLDGVADENAYGAEGSFAALHGLHMVAVTLARSGPVVLCVDDLQWCDPASLRFLSYLTRRMGDLPMLVASAVRTGEDADADDLLAELALEPFTTVLRPRPLDATAIGTLVSSHLGATAAPLFVDACARTTGGNPLLLRQLLQALSASRIRPDAAHAHTVLSLGSRAVSSQVLMRLRRMPPDCSALARAVAVLGDGADLPAAGELAGLDESAAAAALTTLTRAEVLRDSLPLMFVHPLVAEAVYRDMPVADRGLRHEQAADVVRRHAGTPEQVAAHLLLSPRRANSDTVATLRAAARAAAARGASESALTYLRRALDEQPEPPLRTEVLLELGSHETLLDGPAAAEHLLEAYPTLDDVRRRAEVAVTIAWAQLFAGERGEAVSFARQVAADLPDTLDDERQALLALQRASGHMQRVDPALWRDPTLPEPRGDGVGARMLAAMLSWEAVLDGEDRVRVVSLARWALRDDRLWHVDAGLFWIVAAITRMVADDDLGDFWYRARRHVQARGSLFGMLSINLWEGFWRWRLGQLPEAAALVATAAEQERTWRGSGIASAYARACGVAVTLDRGERRAARVLFDAGGPEVFSGEGGWLLRQAECRLLIEEGRFAEAMAAAEQVREQGTATNPAWNPWRSLRAVALAGLGRREQAIPLLEEELHLLRRWGAPSSVGLALTTLGQVSGRTDLLREAVDVLEGTQAALLQTRAWLQLATMPDVADAEAVRLLRRAVDGAVECGAPGVAEIACKALARRGVAPPAAVARHEPAFDAVTMCPPDGSRTDGSRPDGSGTDGCSTDVSRNPQVRHDRLGSPR